MPTEAKDIFEAHSQSLREFLSENGLGLYLPPYQRPYGWDRKKVEKLLDDSLNGLGNLKGNSDSFTFLGTVITIHDVNHVTVEPAVKTEVPAKVLTIIDGQQRISTLLLLVVCLHNLIRQRNWKVFKGTVPDPDDLPKSHLYAETVATLQSLGSAFYEKKTTGDAPIYPRLIRSFQDQWAKQSRLKMYDSPIAHVIYTYAVQADDEGVQKHPSDFRPKVRNDAREGESDLVKRFAEMRKNLSSLAQRKAVEELEEFPSISTIATDAAFQRALFNHELDADFCAWLEDLDDGAEAELVRLVMFSAYILNRVAITVVKGKNEDYAFTIFESLNTTGEPLTAFETFLPRVVMAEGLSDYRDSTAHEYMSDVQRYLNRYNVGSKLQTGTRDLLVSFALAETGKKLSTRLSDQRSYLKDAFEGVKDPPDSRIAFLQHMSDTATFVDMTWDPESGPRQLIALDSDSMTDTVSLCLRFLKDLNHTIAIAPLVRFYNEAARLEVGDEKARRSAEFETALKAITAFTVLWRATRRGTGRIDSEYRAIMGGDSLTGIGPLARRWGLNSDKCHPPPTVDAPALRTELVARLSDAEHGGIPNLASFIAQAAELPLYTQSRPLARFLLLAAHHDTVGDGDAPGLIKIGKTGVSPCFTPSGWADETHLSIEHIAPQQETSGWPKDFYNSRDAVHQIGNLVLVPGNANSSLSSRPWPEKRVLYQALGAETAEDARTILEGSGYTFAQTTTELAQISHHLPHLQALGARSEDWGVDFMEERSRRLLKLAYARLKGWLGLAWLESADAEVVNRVDDAVAEEDD